MRAINHPLKMEFGLSDALLQMLRYTTFILFVFGRRENEHSRCFPYESKDFELEPQFAISLGCDPCKMAEHTRHTPSRLVSHLVSRFPQHACPPLSPRPVFLLSNPLFLSRLARVSTRSCLLSLFSSLTLSRLVFVLSCLVSCLVLLVSWSRGPSVS